ncbi:MAG: CpsD/CapB family tyrosine-protein kinase [Pararhodobacter sp.]|nr:CpsD/CapB family tyrosine-protein kinase [Pararhodobacter sp.]
MVNTRILEERLGWGRSPDGTARSAGAPGQQDTEAENVLHLPEMRSIAHDPLLQGRVSASTRSVARHPAQRGTAEEAWQALPLAAAGVEHLRARRGALHAMDRNSIAAAELDKLRTQLLQVTKARRWRRIGVTAPQRGSGATFVAAGLAASVARIADMRVALLDMDLDAPSLAARLEVPAPPHFADVMTGLQPPTAQMQRLGDNLAVMSGGSAVPNAAELVLGNTIDTMLQDMNSLLAPDMIVLDLPPLLEGGIARALLPHLDTVLLVADGTRNTARDISECEQLLEGQVPLLGVVLNKSEDKAGIRPARR